MLTYTRVYMAAVEAQLPEVNEEVWNVMCRGINVVQEFSSYLAISSKLC